MKRASRVIGAGVLTLSLSACAIMDSIHWKFPGPNGSDVFTTDAKQRHLILAKDGPGKIRVCAEAAPDAFSAFSSSLAGSFGRGSAEAKAEAANAFAETAATIERTQTVNLLRESMYRTCERWLSGAISPEEFLALAARDHRSMVAVLAIEQLTGVVKPPSTVISGPAVNASLRQSAELLKLVDRYGKERATADTAAAATATALAAADKDHKTADGKTVKVCSLTEAPEDTTAAADWSACKTAETKDKTAKQSAADAKERELLVLKQLDDLSGGLAAATTAGTINAGGLTGGISPPDATRLEKIGQTIEKIALTAGIDEALIFCVGYLRAATTDRTTRETCNAVVKQRANSDDQIKLQRYDYTLTPVQVARIDEPISDYERFKTEMVALIAATPPGDWTARWTDFTSATSVPPGSCDSQEDCRLLFVEHQPFTRKFDQNGAPFWTALDQWRRTLKAKGLQP